MSLDQEIKKRANWLFFFFSFCNKGSGCRPQLPGSSAEVRWDRGGGANSRSGPKDWMRTSWMFFAFVSFLQKHCDKYLNDDWLRPISLPPNDLAPFVETL